MTLFSAIDDLAILDTFSIPVTAYKDSGDEFTFQAIFNYPQKVYLDGLQVTDAEPSLTCRSIDVVGLNQTKPITIGDTNYNIRTNMPDGFGMTKLTLVKGKQR